jgi:SAM-dependent methyltransferase
MTKKDTKSEDYANRLKTLSGTKWKQILDVQRPYRWNLKRLSLDRTLDVGCGIGRNLGNLSSDSVGVDHNAHSVEIAKQAGFNAVTVQEFMKNKKKYGKGGFDSMLLAHVLEHLTTQDGIAIIKEYLPYVSDKVVVICPQEKGFKTDETHINYLNHKCIEQILEKSGLTVTKSYSFPLHKLLGSKTFTYNETVVVGTKTSKI